jgi:hypothetical protein
MGTNYYWYERGPCEHCGRDFEGKHIGKSSMGWCFALYVGEYEGPKNLDQWKERFHQPGSMIKNEYGDTVSPLDMLDTITNRESKPAMGYEWTAQEYAQNHAELGPNGLARSLISEGHCIGHGEGTWDYIVGEFS